MKLNYPCVSNEMIRGKCTASCLPIQSGLKMSRILVVDDDMSVRMAIQTLLEHESHEVVTADSGRGGIEAIKNAAFDVVIVDIFMPGMDGLETIRAFHHHAPTVPIIAMSGFLF